MLNYLFLLKLCLVPVLMAGVTLIEGRWGPRIAGWASAFPIIAGPTLLVLTMENGANFGSVAALNTLKGILALLGFGCAYCWSALRFGWLPSLVAALLTHAAISLVLKYCDWSLPLTASIIVGALLIAPRLFPQIPEHQSGSRQMNTLFLRMALGAALVLILSACAQSAGPALSGLLVVMPIASTVLAASSHKHRGNAAAIALLSGMLPGWYAFATFMIALSSMLQRTSMTVAFLTALLAASIAQYLTHIAVRKSYKPIHAKPAMCDESKARAS